MLSAPFPWFGGKSRVADVVWRAFGDDVVNYVEPFFGSGAVLLGRLSPVKFETINDADGFVCNFWRAVAADPDAVAEAADWPVNENDLHARHAWLVDRRSDLTSRLEGDPGYYDTRIAGWWVWGISVWIAGGWCSGNGPWQSVDGRLMSSGGAGVRRQRPNVHRSCGVHRKLMSFPPGKGVHRSTQDLNTWMRALAERLRHVRVCCGDWSRVMGPTPTIHTGSPCGVFLDPPYGSDTGRDMACYAVDSGSVAAAVNAWCVEHGGDKRLRIALCGYEGEHENLGWREHAWKANGGHGNKSASGPGRDNARRERIWFSPGCLQVSPTLWDLLDGGTAESVAASL